MTKLILSTSNIMNGGPSIIRRPTSEKSNTELTNSLRANFLASQEAVAPQVNGSKVETNRFVNSSGKGLSYTAWTTRTERALFVPSIDFSTSGLLEERSQYDITVKLFFLPSTEALEPSEHVEEAISLVLSELHVPSVDLLIVSFSGITFDADDVEDDDIENQDLMEGENLDSMARTWRALEALHAKDVVAQIGLAEFGSERLKKFLPRTKIRPSVDQINVRDCCVVPKDLILYAKQEKIELLTHNDCTNILPGGTVRELLGRGDKGAGVLARSDGDSGGLKGEVEPQWVVKYTAVVRDRGVIENKGYFAMAQVAD
ncbi:hypothetical protein MMC06_004661 [Schaereria dolodes]|nr:hypothetical protein [Schaereria dolodes]